MQKPVIRSELLDIAAYEQARPALRDAVLALKARRRVLVGPHFNFIFENHTTVHYQIQEMMRVERIVNEPAIAHELKTYNALLPPIGGLSATLLLEYQSPQAREENLPKLLGLENHVWLQVGGLPPLPARFEETQIGTKRISSVQYLSFELDQMHHQKWSAAAADGMVR